QIDIFEELLKILSPGYRGELSINTRYSSDPANAYMGNAIFYKKEFTLKEKDILILHQRTEPFPSEINHYEDLGRTALYVKLAINGTLVSFINAHLAWAKTPEEEPHQTKQGEIFLNYLNTISSPFIISGDFNLDPEQPLVQKLNKLA